jgi:hypothetical protein
MFTCQVRKDRLPQIEALQSALNQRVMGNAMSVPIIRTAYDGYVDISREREVGVGFEMVTVSLEREGEAELASIVYDQIQEWEDEDIDPAKIPDLSGRVYDSNLVLEVAAAVIRQHGFVSSKQANESQDKIEYHQLRSTAEVVEELILYGAVHGFTETQITEEDRVYADDAYNWITSAWFVDDYHIKLREVAEIGYITSSQIPLLVSLFSTYERAREKKAVGSFVVVRDDEGWIGLREEMINVYNVRVIYAHRFVDAIYGGEKFKVFFITKDGDLITTVNTGSLSVEEFEVVNIRFKVKDHKEYDGYCETKVTHVKLIDDKGKIIRKDQPIEDQADVVNEKGMSEGVPF